MKKVGIVGHFGFGHDLLNGQTIKVKILFQEFQKQLGNENIVAVDTHGGAKKVPAMITSTIKMFRQCENCMVLPAYKGVLFFTPLFSVLNKIYHRNGIDLSRCIVKESYARKDTFTVLHIGRFMDVKNHELLLRSFARFKGQHSDARLQLLGDGELKENMMQLAGQLNITDAVEFAGLQSNVYPWLHNADVFILPSKFEGMPMTLIEAMGTGLPIIASNVGGIPDMLSSQKEALLIEPKEEKIIEALEMVYSDAKKREYWGRNALQRSSLFSSQAMARKYLQLYSSGR